MISIISFAAVLFGLLIYYNIRKRNHTRKALEAPFPVSWDLLLNQHVQFYNDLPENDKKSFQQKVKLFLSETSITGVKDLIVDDLVKLLVASSAIIPVFLFEGWHYVNLTHVLIYDGAVDPQQERDPEMDGILLGQVRPFQNSHIVLLSKQSLIHGFQSMNGKSNVGFHEFAHLIDELDGSTDGVPNVLMPEELLKPWTSIMYKEIEKIESNRSDINPYALTNHAEFFAVVCEYFFENPDKFKEKHEELFNLMNAIFKR